LLQATFREVSRINKKLFFIMKKLIIALFMTLSFLVSAKATTYTVSVSNYQFSPATVNAVVGDTIKWVWVNGFHTTTSLTIPAGAASWNAPIQNSGETFSYELTVAGTYNYWCAIHTTEMEATINVTGAFPVVFGAFTIASTQDNNALLTWETLTETNTSYYSIRRSTDGNNFSEIAKVTAAGNSTVAKDYSYTDATFNKSSKYIYYSIAVISKDGSTQLSAIKMFQNRSASPKLITSLSPNPVTEGHLMLQFNADQAGEMNVQVYDAAGRIVLTTEMSATQGLNNGHLHLMDVSPGEYTIVFTLNGLRETHSVIVQ
jgi:plastocyanin